MKKVKLIRYITTASVLYIVVGWSHLSAKVDSEQPIDINVKNIHAHLLITSLARMSNKNVVIGDEFKRLRISISETSILPSELITKIASSQGLVTRKDNGIIKIASNCRFKHPSDFHKNVSNRKIVSLNFDNIKTKKIINIFEKANNKVLNLRSVNIAGHASIVVRNRPVSDIFRALSITQGWGSNRCKNPNNYIVSNSKYKHKEFKCSTSLKTECSILERYDLRDLMFVGYIKKSKDKKFHAIIESVDEQAYILKVGQYIGKNYGRVKEINSNGKIHIEEIVSNSLGGYMENNIVFELGVPFETDREKLVKELRPKIITTVLQKSFIDAVRNNDIDKLKKLAKIKSIDVNAVSEINGWNALSLAIHKNHLDIIKWLVDNGAKIDVLVTKKEKSPLVLASSYNMQEIVKILLSKKALVDLVDSKKFTPLHIAVSNGNGAIVRLLVNHGANVFNYSSAGLTPFTLAAYSGDTELVKFFIENGVDINSKDRNGNTMLIAAIFGSKISLIKVLVNKGADINFLNKRKESILELAISKGNIRIIEFLKSKGAVIPDTNN